jgi:hypothetical protein
MKLRLAGVFLLLVLWATPALAQGCVMCATSAQGAGAEGRRALLRGVVVLLVPPVAILGVLVGVAFRYNRNGHSQGG